MKRGRRIGSRVASVNIGIAAFCACASDSFQPQYNLHNSMAITTQRRRPRQRPCVQLMNNDERLAPSTKKTTMANNDADEFRRPQFVISGAPTRFDDYEDIGRLLCEVFDDNAVSKQQQGGKSTSSSVLGAASGGAVSSFLWNTITRTLAAAQYTNRYISNARKMRGKKYALLVAKSFGSNNNDNNNNRVIKPGQVIAMAEVGVSRYPILSDVTGTGGSSDDREHDETDVLASIGVLCVEESQRRSGAASELLKAAESLARRRWNETSLYAAVEESNTGALRFFNAAGYEDSGLVVQVEVSERMRKGEMRRHLLLQKRLLPAN